MPRLNGIKASKQIRENFPDVKILMLSMHNNRELITESLKAGAMGYILKECSSEELFYAVSSVMNGQYYIAHSSLTILLDDYMRLLEEEKKSAPCQLFEREIEVLRLITEGKNTKIGCTSIAGLIRYAIREGY